jgi:hypothetical protein
MARGKARKARNEGDAGKRPGGLRPILLGAGLGLFWFVEVQGNAAVPDAPAWGYMVMLGVRLLVDLIGGWLFVSAARLAFELGRLAIAYARTSWVNR